MSRSDITVQDIPKLLIHTSVDMIREDQKIHVVEGVEVDIRKSESFLSPSSSLAILCVSQSVSNDIDNHFQWLKNRNLHGVTGQRAFCPDPGSMADCCLSGPSSFLHKLLFCFLAQCRSSP